MAQKAEEYGSHPHDLRDARRTGTVKMILDDGTVLHSHEVTAGDIWRSASTRKAPIEDWVNLAHRAAGADRLSVDLSGWTRPAPMTRS